jgi:F-type H+-transporting ATPase subunit c
MKKNIKFFGLLVFFLVLASTPLLAQETELTEIRASLFKWSLIIGGAIITLTAAAGAYCQAKAISAACEGISRNPAAAPHIRFLLLLGLVLIETLVIYSLFVSIIILMMKWGKFS